jgi:hypothetical protein
MLSYTLTNLQLFQLGCRPISPGNMRHVFGNAGLIDFTKNSEINQKSV